MFNVDDAHLRPAPRSDNFANTRNGRSKYRVHFLVDIFATVDKFHVVKRTKPVLRRHSHSTETGEHAAKTAGNLCDPFGESALKPAELHNSLRIAFVDLIAAQTFFDRNAFGALFPTFDIVK